jgi:glycosyltransferase involved in cell wall biosynthesis
MEKWQSMSSTDTRIRSSPASAGSPPSDSSPGSVGSPVLGTVLLAAYSCCPGRSSEPGYGWNYLLQYARISRHVILLTSQPDHAAVLEKIRELGIDNVTVLAPRLGFGLERLFHIPIGGIHLHYFLWLYKARAAVRRLTEKIDLAHHVTFGSLQFGSPVYEVKCPFLFGPVGGGQRTNKVFYPLMGRSRYFENIRNLVSDLFYRFNPFFKQTLQNAGMIYVVNRETRRDTLRFLSPSRHANVKMMTDTALESQFLEELPVRSPSTGTFRALWVGRLLPRKGIEILLRTVLLLKNEDFELTILGDGPLREKVQQFIKENGLEKTVRFMGWVDYQQTISYYRASDVLLFLSYRDSTGLQIVEALSQGLPVISFDQFGASLVIHDQVGIKIPIEKDLGTIQRHIADAIRELIHNRSRVAIMGRNAARYATAFTWDQKMHTILEDINHLLHYADADLRLERV